MPMSGMRPSPELHGHVRPPPRWKVPGQTLPNRRGDVGTWFPQERGGVLDPLRTLVFLGTSRAGAAIGIEPNLCVIPGCAMKFRPHLIAVPNSDPQHDNPHLQTTAPPSINPASGLSAFESMTACEKRQAVRDLARAGLGDHDIAEVTGLHVEMIRRILAMKDCP
jgi:hypothetical protein